MSLPTPLFILIHKCPRAVTFNLDTSNMLDWFKLFLLIYIFLDSFVNTEFHLCAQLALNLSGIPDGSLVGLDWHEFFYALCKISPSLVLEDPAVLLNGLLVPLACFLSPLVSNP